MSGGSCVTPGRGGNPAGFALEPAPGPAFSIGTVESVTGTCTVTRAASDPIQIKLGHSLCEGDIVDTAADGQVSIRFMDGTVFTLSSSTRVALNECVCDQAAPSAVLNVTCGSFAFIAGTMAKAGRLGIETPVASIRGRMHTGGLGMLTLAALFFAAIEEVQAASSDVAFVDDGIITYKDLEHGTFELVTKEAVPRHIFVDDPGETIVLHRNGSAISADHVTNTVAQMAQLQAAQQEALQTFSLGLQGPTATGPSGSSTPPVFEFPAFVQPINFTQPDNNSLPQFTNSGAPSSNAPPAPVHEIFLAPPPAAPATIVEHDGSIVERVNVTGDTAADSASTTFSLNGGNLSVSAPTFVWSAGNLTAAQQSALGAASTLTVIPTGGGAIDATFSAPDKVFDFLALGETLTVTYQVGSSQLVTVKIIGTEDAPVLAADASGPHQITEQPFNPGNTPVSDAVSGTLQFTDADLNDTHTVSAGLISAVWSGGSTLPSRLSATLAGALLTTEADSTGSGAGSVFFTFNAADNKFDFLAKGETLTVTYDATVTDDNHISSTQPVTVTITGSNDTPMLAADASGPHEITEQSFNPSNTSVSDAASGTLQFTDADLNDTHTVSAGLVSAVWSGGSTLPSGLSATLAGALLTTEADSTGSGAGSVFFTFNAAENNFDFLAKDDTLTVTYNVTVTDDNHISSTQPVTVTIIGTTAAATIHLPPADDAPTATADHVITNIGDNTQFQIPDSALIANDTDPDNPQSQLTIAAVNDNSGADSSLGDGVVNFKDTHAGDNSFDYTLSDGSLTATGHVTVSQDANSALDGTNASDILIGKPGGSTINGEGGNDILIGNTGADTLVGGSGNDRFVFRAVTDSQPGNGHFDTIVDFTAGSDHVDLTAIAGATNVQGLVATADSVAAHSISWFIDSARNQTILYVNSTAVSNHVDMEIHLIGTNIDLSGADILHHI